MERQAEPIGIAAAGEVPAGSVAVAETASTAERWQDRAALWELLALSLRYPEDSVLAEAVSSGAWADAAFEIAGALGIELPATFGSCARAACGQDAATFAHTLRIEATRLFVGTPTPAVSPYEGMWRARAEGVPGLKFVNPHTEDVERFMGECGLTRPAGTNEPLDHAATECELLEALAVRAMDGDDDADERYGRFLGEHLRAWVGDFTESLALEARLPIYRAAAQLLCAATA